MLSFPLLYIATPPSLEDILDKMNYELVMSLTVEAPVSKIFNLFSIYLNISLLAGNLVH